MAIIEIENLTKDYEVGFLKKRRVRALNDLSLAVEQGEIFGFLGPNGAGKTTTIKLLMRLIYPTTGRARILGRDISDISMHRRIGYLPEQPYFYDYLTARELLEYCAELFGIKREARRKRAAELLHLVGLEEKSWTKQLRKLSKGMTQRVGLAQALVNDPEIVFLDEPMSGLDPIGRREVRDIIQSLRSRGKTVFLCSHILADIEVLCDRAAVMRGGRLAHLGALEELRKRGSDGRMEVTIAASDPSSVTSALASLAGARVEQTPGGARIEVESEDYVDEAIKRARSGGARLISVQPVSGGLENLFVRDEIEREAQGAT
ncbi:MAG: ABC transporter ATP-binding protein [Pyrinomonadaceae bacterium]|nr:ABC transporter ATP-binding protein [Pyrinomonadaceae bacterium]